MPDAPAFTGFEAPKENFYRLPNNWFSDIIPLLRSKYGERLAAPLKMMEYILRHTWGFQEWSGKLCLSAKEIRNGRKRGTYTDYGTGISENTVKTAGDILEELGLLTISQDTVDKARRYKTYSPRIIAPIGEETSDEFHGFVPPTTNYFVVPHNWTDLTKEISSGATIIVVEYAFRHAWGYSNENGTWMSVDEFVHGRKYKTSDRRYDNGIGFDDATIYRALDEAVKRGLMVYAEYTDENYYTRKVYNLRLANMKIDPETGACLSPLPEDIRTVEVVSRTVEGRDVRTNEVDIRTIEAMFRTNEVDDIRTNEAAIRTVEADIRIVKARSLKDTKSLNTKSKTLTSTTPQHTSPKSIPAVVADIELPQIILAGLEQIGWTDTLTEIQKAFAENPGLVQVWLNFALHAPRVQKRAGMFRKGLRSKAMPAYQIKPTLEVDDIAEETEIVENATNDYATDISSEAAQVWEIVQNQLEREMPRTQFITHVKGARAMNFVNNILQIDAFSQERKDWLESRIQSTAEHMLIGILKKQVTVQFLATQ